MRCNIISIIVSNNNSNNIFNNMNALFLSFAFAHYVACTAWVMYHLANTARSLQKDVARQGKEINKLSSKLGMLNSKLNDDSSGCSSSSGCGCSSGCSGCETNSVTVNSSDDDVDERSETSSLGPCPSITVNLPADHSLCNDPIVEHMIKRLSQIERDLDMYLDKAFMLVGFTPETGMPLYVTQHDADGNVMIRDAVADYWKSGQMPDFVGEQFTSPDSEETELDDV